MLFCWRPSLAGKATLVGVAAFILLAAFVFFRTGCGYVPLHPSGSFTIGGEAKSRFIGLVHSDRYGSWSGSDRNVGVLTSDAFRAPAALTFFVAGYPSHPNEELSVTRLDTHELLRLFTPSHPTGPDPQRTWAIFYIGLPSSWRGVQIQLVVRDNGRGSDDWVGIASLRAARLDEWMLAAPVDTPWAYVGFGYIALIFYGFSRLIGPIGKLVRDPWAMRRCSALLGHSRAEIDERPWPAPVSRSHSSFK
jgi:hypothetical protein